MLFILKGQSPSLQINRGYIITPAMVSTFPIHHWVGRLLCHRYGSQGSCKYLWAAADEPWLSPITTVNHITQKMWDSRDRTHNIPQIITLKSNLLKRMFLLSAYQSGKIRANDTFVLGHFHSGMKNSQQYQFPKANFIQFTHPNTKSKNDFRTWTFSCWLMQDQCMQPPAFLWSSWPPGLPKSSWAPSCWAQSKYHWTTASRTFTTQIENAESGGGCGGSRGEVIHSSLRRRLIAAIWPAPS